MEINELIIQLEKLKSIGVEEILFSLDTSINAPANPFCYFDVDLSSSSAVMHNFLNDYQR